VVDSALRVVYDTFVKPEDDVVDFNTRSALPVLHPGALTRWFSAGLAAGPTRVLSL